MLEYYVPCEEIDLWWLMMCHEDYYDEGEKWIK